KLKGKESSSLFKMAIGTIIMGLGFIFMMFASREASSENFGKASMVWIFLAYLFHTIGELSTSPVSLSFITKLAPLKYASIMMGIYFAATGLGNKLAGTIGSTSQLEVYEGKLTSSKDTINAITGKQEIETSKNKTELVYPINWDKNIELQSEVYLSGNTIVFKKYQSDRVISDLFELDSKNEKRLKEELSEYQASQEKPLHAKLLLEKDEEAVKVKENRGDGKDYSVSFVISETQNAQELKIFTWITIFTVAFGILLIIFLKKLKKLTHGAEENERDIHENEGFELAEN